MMLDIVELTDLILDYSKVDNEKDKKIGGKCMKKKIISILLCLTFIMAVLTGCSNPAPDKVVESFLQAYQSADFAAAAQYLTTGEDATFIESENDKIVDIIMAAVEYENITTDSKTKEDAIVTATITALDTVTIMNNVMKEAMGLAFVYAFSDDPNADEDFDAMLDRMMNNAFAATDAPKVKITVDIVLKNTESGWKIEPTTEFMDAITGGLFTYAGGISDEEENKPIGEEQAKEYLRDALAGQYPEYAEYDYDFYDNGEEEDYYSYQAFLMKEGATSNNMGFYKVDKYTGVVYYEDMVTLELVRIYTP